MSDGNIAVIDWGIGGLGFYKLLCARQPAARPVYLSDAGYAPYGKVPRPELAARIGALLAWLAREQGVNRVVIACNAASTVLGELQPPTALLVTGVITPALTELATWSPRRIGVIGGLRTVESGIYGQRLRAAGHTVFERNAQPLSAHVEAGRLRGGPAEPELETDLVQILQPLQDVDLLVLACTHYVALAAHFARLLPRATLYDPAAATLRHVEARWSLATAASSARFFTTGSPEATRVAARAAFDVEMPTLQAVGI